MIRWRTESRLKFRTVFLPNTAHQTSLELVLHFAERYWTLCRFTCSLERQRQACSELPIYMASRLGMENCSSPVWKRVAPTTPLSGKREREHYGRKERRGERGGEVGDYENGARECQWKRRFSDFQRKMFCYHYA